MRPLDKKMFRELWAMKTQALAIALVIAGGVATLVMSLSTIDSLKATRASFYTEYRFSDVFASLKRAPKSMASRILEIPGVEKVETRVVAPVSVDVADFPDPVTGLIVSIPEGREPSQNALYLRSGRLVEPGRADELVISDSFAESHGLRPGSQLRVTINGKRRTLKVVGVALSPEHVFQIGPGALFPDFKRYGVFWLGQKQLSVAFDMEGAFNDVVLKLAPRSSPEEVQDVIERLDKLLSPYGGLGAYGREDQLSHNFLSEELKQLARMATIFPVIFLSVAAFLLNVVVSRIISIQREQVGILKAFGHTNTTIALHYLKLVLIIVLSGLAIGVGGGMKLGTWLSNMYMDFYRFPFMDYELRGEVVLTAAVVSMAAAFSGTVFALRRAAILPPAEAMRPESPVSYRETIIERLGLKRVFSQPGRMVLRHIGRRPVKSALTVIGIAFASAIMVMGGFFEDAVDHMVKVRFVLSERDDLRVSFSEPSSRRALHELRAMEGVLYVEPIRSVPARLSFGHRSYRTVINGMGGLGDTGGGVRAPDSGALHRLFDTELKQVEVPPDGIVLTEYLGNTLGARPGDLIHVRVLEGARPEFEIPLATLVKEYIGVSGYMDMTTLGRKMREVGVVTGARLAIDASFKERIYEEIKGMPGVAGSVAGKDALNNFYDTMADQMLVFTFVNTLLAVTIAFGVVYNSARIALTERERELASLRVLGFTRAEISYILLGELALLTILALPFGALIGWSLSGYMAASLKSDLYRIPHVVERSTYAFSATVVVIAACFSSLTVAIKLGRLDLVRALKTKE